jgi:transcriptional regulator
VKSEWKEDWVRSDAHLRNVVFIRRYEQSMYLPDVFHETNFSAIVALIARYPLATLVTLQGGKIVADHIPFLLDAEGKTLRAHVARANPLWRTFDPSGDALAIFSGVAHYVTPSWYASKREAGKVVPTWNYEVAHVYGRMRAIDNVDWVHSLLRDLTGRQEAGRSDPWALEDAPAEFIAAQLKAVVGIEISVSHIEAKRKFSQNRTAADRAGVIAGLLTEGDEDAHAMAGTMTSNEPAFGTHK